MWLRPTPASIPGRLTELHTLEHQTDVAAAFRTGAWVLIFFNYLFTSASLYGGSWQFSSSLMISAASANIDWEQNKKEHHTLQTNLYDQTGNKFATLSLLVYQLNCLISLIPYSILFLYRNCRWMAIMNQCLIYQTPRIGWTPPSPLSRHLNSLYDAKSTKASLVTQYGSSPCPSIRCTLLNGYVILVKKWNRYVIIYSRST